MAILLKSFTKNEFPINACIQGILRLISSNTEI